MISTCTDESFSIIRKKYRSLVLTPCVSISRKLLIPLACSLALSWALLNFLRSRLARKSMVLVILFSTKDLYLVASTSLRKSTSDLLFSSVRTSRLISHWTFLFRNSLSHPVFGAWTKSKLPLLGNYYTIILSIFPQNLI